MERVFGYVPRDMSHNARFGRIAKLLYPYHPLFEGQATSLEVVEVRSDMLVVKLPAGGRRGIPTWMFDEVTCGEIRSSATPLVAPESLMEIAKLLELNGVNIPCEADESKVQSHEGNNEKFAADTNRPDIRRGRKRKKDRQRKQGSLRSTDRRVVRDRGTKSSNSKRRE